MPKEQHPRPLRRRPGKTSRLTIVAIMILAAGVSALTVLAFLR